MVGERRHAAGGAERNAKTLEHEHAYGRVAPADEQLESDGEERRESEHRRGAVELRELLAQVRDHKHNGGGKLELGHVDAAASAASSSVCAVVNASLAAEYVSTRPARTVCVSSLPR